jgi:lipopolysaccharide transport system permease protein
MTLIFSTMFSRNIPNFPVYLLCGNLLFGFIRESTMHAMNSITGNAVLLKKIYVPKYIFTLSSVTGDFITLAFSLCALFIVMLATKVHFSLYTIFFFIPLIEMYIFSLGMGFFLACLTVFFKDIQYIWGALVLAWMYATPIFYPIELLPDRIEWIIKRFNPAYYYITVFRDFVMYGQPPWWPNVFRGAIIAVLLFCFGLFTFERVKNSFIIYI